MVGIVLVSHSATLAEGAAELARQMGGEAVAIEPAGGLDLPERPIGTDAVVVIGAIDRAWSDDGVLVLMDLGSAVLSAEMALEMLEEERRGRVVLAAAPFVEGAVAAAVAARLGRSLDEVAAEARGGLAPKVEQLGEDPSTRTVPAVDGDGGSADERGPERSLRLVVTNRLGLHARPAARFVTTAARFDARVRIRDVTNGRGPADARSLNAVATLGVLRGHEVEVTASGSAAADALDAIRALAAANFGDADETQVPVAGPFEPPPHAAGDDSLMIGIAVSPGIAVGPVRHLVRASAAEQRVGAPAGTPSHERARFDAAIAAMADEIRATRVSVAARTGESAAEIFDAHLLILLDEELLGPVRDAIAGGRPAVDAWRSAIARAAARWRELEDPYLRSRAEDVEAVGDQVADALAGAGSLRPSGPGVLVAADLTPAQTAALDVGVVTAVATARGGPTSHAAVLARSLDLPAVVALGDRLLEVAEGTEVVLDGRDGWIRIEPDEHQRAEAEERAAVIRAAEADARAAASGPAITRDGTTIDVFANVGRPVDAALAAASGADGVGLLRSEFLFLDRDRMPDEEEQLLAYRAVADAFGGRPVVLRTLDVGGDKPLPYLPIATEANPFLGLRGLRLGLARPDVLRTQLRAAARTALDRPLRVMFPMVTTVEEVVRARAILDEVVAELDERPTRLDVGVMVEVPAAALAAPALAEAVDFFSIGTNDLAQYTLAAERGNAAVAALSDALHPAVLRLVELTATAAADRDLPVGVCGDLASDVVAVPVLLGLGVRELSVAAPAVARVKAAVRDADLDRARDLARRVLGCASAAEVRALVG